MADKEFEKVIDLFDDFGEKLKVDAIASLKSKGHTASGQSGLAGSMRFTIRKTDKGLTFFFYMADYGDYIDAGTRKATRRGTGGNKMVDSLEAWIQQRPSLLSVVKQLQTSYKDKGILKKRKKAISFNEAKEGLAIGIKKSIHRKGIIKRFGYKGSKFFSSVIGDGRVQKLEEGLADILGQEIKIIFSNGILKGTV